jgi:kumamolisin
VKLYRLGKLTLPCLVVWLMVSACLGIGDSTPPKPTPTPVSFSSFNLQIPSEALATPVDKPVPDSMAMHVSMLFKLNASQQNQLQKIDTTLGQQDLQKEANKLGITDAQFALVKNYLAQEQVTVNINKLHTSVTADGKALAFSHIFQTTFVYHTYQKRQFFVPTTSPKVPTFMLPSIVSITGLDSYSAPIQTGIALHTKSYDFIHGSKADCTPEAGSVLPQDVATAYGFNPFLAHRFAGQNMTIILIEIDGVNSSDISNYAACVNYRGKIDVKTVGTAPAEVEGETTLDMDMIMGLDPDVHIIDYQTGDNSAAGLAAVVQQVVNDETKAAPGTIVSMSLGAAENLSTKTYLDGMDQLLQTLNLEHITTFVSSGDCAAFADHTWGSVSVSFPASNPHVIAVGGTELSTNASGNRLSEVAWSDGSDETQCTNQWGSGGGNSNYFPPPQFQQGPGVQNSNSRGFRQIPDVSAVAFNLPVYQDGQWQLVGGTSAAAPIWAAGMSLVNEALITNKKVYYSGPVVPYYVANHKLGHDVGLVDITSGNNIAFQAGPGWDFPTGLGAPNFLSYYQILQAVK